MMKSVNQPITTVTVILLQKNVNIKANYEAPMRVTLYHQEPWRAKFYISLSPAIGRGLKGILNLLPGYPQPNTLPFPGTRYGISYMLLWHSCDSPLLRM